MAEEYFDFDAAEWLESEEAIAEYMAAALETGDASFIKEALNDIVRARGMSGIARDTGLSRGSLYRALSEEGNPTLDSFLLVLKALNVTLSAKIVEAAIEPTIGAKAAQPKTKAKAKPGAKAKTRPKRKAAVRKKAPPKKKPVAA